MNGIGARIRDMRTMLDINQKELGMMVGLSSGAVSSIEAGERNPPFDAFLSICEVAYKATINLDWLVCGHGDPLKTLEEIRSAYSEEEDDLLQMYRSLAREGQRIVMGHATEQVQIARLEGDKAKTGEAE